MSGVKRTMVFDSDEGPVATVNLEKFVVVKATKKFFHLEELKSGAMRLTVSDALIADMSKVDSIKIIRED